MSTGLPQLADAKAYLRQTDTTVEDTLIQALLDRAYGVVQGWLSRPIISVQDTFIVEHRGQATRALDVGTSPIDTTQPITVVDGAGFTIPANEIRANAKLGLLFRAPAGFATVSPQFSWFWECFPYTVTLSSGLSARADYALVVAPSVGAAILDCVADAFQRRNPAATSESAGGGVSQSFPQVNVGLTARAMQYLAPFRRVTA